MYLRLSRASTRPEARGLGGFYIPPKIQRELSDRNIGGVSMTQSQLFQPSSIRAAMASHRGIDGSGWTTADRRPPAADTDTDSHQCGETLFGEIPSSKVADSSQSRVLARATAGFHSSVPSSSCVSHTGESIPVRSVSDQQFGAVGAAASQSSGTKDAANLPANHATTQVVVHYTVPEGQRYLPITLNHMVTMIFIGKHGEDFVYEPINNWLQSPEEGLRYHRTMDVNDVYDGCLDMATFGRRVVGPISEDNKWLVNPLVYDPTRPLLGWRDNW